MTSNNVIIIANLCQSHYKSLLRQEMPFTKIEKIYKCRVDSPDLETLVRRKFNFLSFVEFTWNGNISMIQL